MESGNLLVFTLIVDLPKQCRELLFRFFEQRGQPGIITDFTV